jgi:hypothetical protein
VTRGDGGEWWAVWPLLWWGLALLLHAATVVFGVFSPDWKERETQRILKRDRRTAE